MKRRSKTSLPKISVRSRVDPRAVGSTFEGGVLHIRIPVRIETIVRPHMIEEQKNLSARESQMFHLLRLRLQDKEIAARVGISTRTVKYHIGGMYRKLGVRNRAEFWKVHGFTTEGK